MSIAKFGCESFLTQSNKFFVYLVFKRKGMLPNFWFIVIQRMMFTHSINDNLKLKSIKDRLFAQFLKNLSFKKLTEKSIVLNSYHQPKNIQHCTWHITWTQIFHLSANRYLRYLSSKLLHWAQKSSSIQLMLLEFMDYGHATEMYRLYLGSLRTKQVSSSKLHCFPGNL